MVHFVHVMQAEVNAPPMRDGSGFRLADFQCLYRGTNRVLERCADTAPYPHGSQHSAASDAGDPDVWQFVRVGTWLPATQFRAVVSIGREVRTELVQDISPLYPCITACRTADLAKRSWSSTRFIDSAGCLVGSITGVAPRSRA
jgi:hypothetical protein